MTIEKSFIEVSGQRVEVVRKDIKNIHIAVYPPGGRVRIAVPRNVTADAVRLAVATRMGWIRRRQAGFGEQDRQSQREMVSGETHYVLGRRYRLRIVEATRNSIKVRSGNILELSLRRGYSAEDRREILDRWYRQTLRTIVPDMIARWETKIGVKVAELGIKRMKTRWGTCTAAAGRIWLNTELAKKPKACLEYIVVHEMIHLLERHHNDRFKELLDGFMPQWRLQRDELNRAPLSHEAWSY